MPRLLLITILLLPFVVNGAKAAPDFSRDVLPILSDTCFACHGPDANARKAKLRLDREKDAKAEVIVPGKSAASELIARVFSSDPDERMPPPNSKLKLTAEQKATLKAWVDAGAKWGKHWAYEPPRRSALPKVNHAKWPRNGIDRFILARLERERLKPSAEAGKITWLRRVTLDLTGLPPTLKEADDFLKSSIENPKSSFKNVVDRLLASPRYGERMAWDWLEAARYADSNGYQGDNDRTMWPWRDWVVRTLNANVPYDTFTIEQLAGDLLPKATDEQRLATAFNRNHMINGEGGRIAEENRVEYIFDQMETMSTLWLGATMTCSRCHDHKFDAITQRDYYGLFAFFNNTPVNGGGGSGQTAPVLAVASAAQQKEISELEEKIQSLKEKPKIDAAKKRIADLRKKFPKVMVMQEQAKARTTKVLVRGVYNNPSNVTVTSAWPTVFGANAQSGTPNRLHLAQWLVNDRHPLTARVTVNRIWQQFFGTGLVKTPEDFGVQGERPSHPELLDWLALEFIESGWDVKALHKRIVLSATYRQTSRVTPALRERDPKNRLLARMTRQRLPSWMIRDQALFISGLLVEKRGGPSVKSYQPAGVWAEATFGKKKYARGKGEDLYRRSLYTFWRRIIGPTIFFDESKRQTCQVRRSLTNTPLHALIILNDTTYVEAARALAQRVIKEGGADDKARTAYAFRLATARAPKPKEAAVLLQSIQKLRATYAQDPKKTKALLAIGESKRDEKLNPTDHAAFTVLCNMILNLDEVITRE
ncbi:MAG: PSD1 domain-containing protein [Verrucomicrobia subdivision 3 bacterium]|nr:PSD1 domain-containing protein [Limisphaerales bacterium]